MRSSTSPTRTCATWRSRRWRSIREPRAIPELRAIWQKSNDLAWSAAAIRALGRLGEADIASRLLALAQDLKDPLTAPALIALGDLDETRALPLVRAGLASRSDEVVIAATRAARRLLAKPGVRADDVRDGLAGLLADVHASLPVREAALQALTTLDDPRLAEALGAAVRDAALEGSPLLQSRRGTPRRAEGSDQVALSRDTRSGPGSHRGVATASMWPCEVGVAGELRPSTASMPPISTSARRSSSSDSTYSWLRSKYIRRASSTMGQAVRRCW